MEPELQRVLEESAKEMARRILDLSRIAGETTLLYDRLLQMAGLVGDTEVVSRSQDAAVYLERVKR